MPRRRHVYCASCGRGMALRPEMNCYNCGHVHQGNMVDVPANHGDSTVIRGIRVTLSAHSQGGRWVVQIEGGHRLQFDSREIAMAVIDELRAGRTTWAREILADGTPIRRRAPRARRSRQQDLPFHDDRVDRGNGPGED